MKYHERQKNKFDQGVNIFSSDPLYNLLKRGVLDRQHCTQ